jgi:hypothetical protein
VKKRILKRHLHGGPEENNESRHRTAAFFMIDREMRQINVEVVVNYMKGLRNSQKPHTKTVYVWMA